MLLLLLLLHFAGFRKPKVLLKTWFCSTILLVFILGFLFVDLQSALSLSTSQLCTNPSTAGSRSNLNENPSSLVAAGFYSNSNQHSSVNPRSWVVGEQRSVDLGQEEFWVWILWADSILLRKDKLEESSLGHGDHQHRPPTPRWSQMLAPSSTCPLTSGRRGKLANAVQLLSVLCCYS